MSSKTLLIADQFAKLPDDSVFRDQGGLLGNFRGQRRPRPCLQRRRKVL